MGEDSPTLQAVALLATFLGYFLFSEGFVSRTPGKFIAGLVVVQTNGRPCTWWQVFIRTGFRVLEVNPIFLGESKKGTFYFVGSNPPRTSRRQ
jgi:uncharacterized RDD family membrane protein YckC